MHEHSVNLQRVTAVVLAGSGDFGRCPIAKRLPPALWPIEGRPALERLLVHLADQGVKRAVICSNGDSALLQKSIHVGNHLLVEFLDEQLPVGTAGCIREAVQPPAVISNLLMVLPANIICPPPIDDLIRAHRRGQSDLTMMFNPAHRNGELLGKPADMYVCDAFIVGHIPKQGYFDIKEGLIPKMRRAGKTIHAARLANHAGNFRDRRGYLHAIANYLEDGPEMDTDLRLCKQTDSQTLRMAPSANVDSSARIYGPVTIMKGASISRDVLIFGPTVIGQNVSVDENSVVVNSTIWDGAHIGANCQIQRCIVDYDAAVSRNTVVEDKSIAFEPGGAPKRFVSTTSWGAASITGRLRYALQPQLARIGEGLQNWARVNKKRGLFWVVASFVFLAFLWSYWPNLRELWSLWQRSDEYSSGLLVPFLAVYVLWSRRHALAQCPMRPSIWGLFAFLAVQAVRIFGLFFTYGFLERLSIALSIAALVLLLFGWQLFRKVSMVLFFLCLMLPWPSMAQVVVGLPLQRLATSSAVFCLEAVGYEVLREGNIIHIGNATVAVVEACNGLRMITAFFVITGLVAMLVKRAWWEKMIILASSLPIALLCNTARLTITAVAFTMLNGEYWQGIFHDFGGYAMMPLALSIVVAELWILMKLTTLPEKEEAIITPSRSSNRCC